MFPEYDKINRSDIRPLLSVLALWSISFDVLRTPVVYAFRSSRKLAAVGVQFAQIHCTERIRVAQSCLSCWLLLTATGGLEDCLATPVKQAAGVSGRMNCGLRVGGGQLVSGQRYFAYFEWTGNIEGISKRTTRYSLYYEGFFPQLLELMCYKVIHSLLVKPVAFQKSFCHFFCNNHNTFYNLNPEITLSA
jgi:hypothetical protein